MKLPRMEQNGGISQDELVVLQLLEEIQQLVTLGGGGAGTNEDGGEPNPRLHAAAKLYLDTRDTFEVIENLVEQHVLDRPRPQRRLSQRSVMDDASTSETAETAASPAIGRTRSLPPNEAVIDRIQDMFRHLGELLGVPVLKELRQRKLTIKSILHYVRFLPVELQWTAYKEARKEEVALAYRESVFSSLSTLKPASISHTSQLTDAQALKQRAAFVKQHVRKDVDTVCLFASDGTLSTIFGDDTSTVEENVAAKFESLMSDVYSDYLRDTLDVHMAHLTQLADQWADDMATAASHSTAASGAIVECFSRLRKFRSKSTVFPEKLMGIMDRAVRLPPTPPGQRPKLLVADDHFVGVWWQKTVLSVTERDVSTVHCDAGRDILERVETLDGQLYVPLLEKLGDGDGFRLFGRSEGLAKWLGQRVLVNNGKDSLWVEVTVTGVEDKRCKLKVKKSLHKDVEVANWVQYLTLHEWVNVRELRFVAAPVNPNFRVHMGIRFREVVEAVQAVVVEVSSVFPNGELNDKVGSALWRSVEPSISKGEHIFARYFRSILQQEIVSPSPPPPSTGSLTRAGSIGSLSLGSDEAPPIVVREIASFHGTAAPPASSRSSNYSGNPPLPGYFDENGVFRCVRASRTTRSGASRRATAVETAPVQVISPFEKLAHHLLEETEIIGTSIQAQNVALSCAFVQVLLEKLARLKRELHDTLHLSRVEAVCTLEQILSEYANSCRLLFVWRICRHQLDTMARQGRRRRGRNGDSRRIHLEWVDRAFERVESQVLEVMESLVHFAHRTLFHECVSSLLPGIYEQAWTASRPWFNNTRCTYAVQALIFRLQMLFEYVNGSLLSCYERTLGVHEKIYDLAARMLLDVLTCAEEAYASLTVSRARDSQWKIDVLYLVCGVYKLLRLLDQMLSSRSAAPNTKGKRKVTNDIRGACLRLLVRLAVKCGPADAVLESIAKKVEAESFEQHADVDVISELEVHVNCISAALDTRALIPGHTGNDEDESDFWHIHSIFGILDIKSLVDVELNWGVLISRCSLSKRELIGLLRQRHELGDWLFPVLTESELQIRGQLLKFLEQLRVDDHEQQKTSSHPEDEAVGGKASIGSDPLLLKSTPRESAMNTPQSEST